MHRQIVNEFLNFSAGYWFMRREKVRGVTDQMDIVEDPGNGALEYRPCQDGSLESMPTS